MTTTITLLVEFDADQTAARLTWDTSPDSTPLTGVHAGALALPAGTLLGLKVKGVGDAVTSAANPHPMTGFTVRECSVVTQPMMASCAPPPAETTFFPPSPFLNIPAAALTLAPGYTTASITDSGVITIIDTWNSTQEVGATTGRWTLFFFLTVDLVRDGVATPVPRVFNFDCEVQVY